MHPPLDTKILMVFSEYLRFTSGTLANRGDIETNLLRWRRSMLAAVPAGSAMTGRWCVRQVVAVRRRQRVALDAQAR